MLTPQEVSSHAFTKAVMGGYNMAMVDEFLDEVTDDYTALYKENAALKAKMKVLVEKVEEYRATEDSMRATLLTAQRMADTIVREAEQKRDAMLAEARFGVEEKLANYSHELAEAEARLQQGQADLMHFISAARDLCQRELRFLDQLPSVHVKVTPPVMEDTSVAQIEETVMAAFAAQDAAEAAEEPVEEIAEAPVEEPKKPVVIELPVEEGDPFATRRIDLDDLKFGRNYGKD